MASRVVVLPLGEVVLLTLNDDVQSGIRIHFVTSVDHLVHEDDQQTVETKGRKGEATWPMKLTNKRNTYTNKMQGESWKRGKDGGEGTAKGGEELIK